MEAGEVTLKIVLTALWGICFFVLNVGAKRLAASITLEKGLAGSIMAFISSPWAYIVVGLYGVCAIIYMLLLRILPISVAGPVVLSFGIVILTLAGAVIFREEVFRPAQIAGIILCLAGILLLQLGAKG